MVVPLMRNQRSVYIINFVMSPQPANDIPRDIDRDIGERRFLPDQLTQQEDLKLASVFVVMDSGKTRSVPP